MISSHFAYYNSDEKQKQKLRACIGLLIKIWLKKMAKTLKYKYDRWSICVCYNTEPMDIIGFNKKCLYKFVI